MSGDPWESRPDADELQGALRDAVSSIRANPPPEGLEKQAVERVLRWAATLDRPGQAAWGRPQQRRCMRGWRVWCPAVAVAVVAAACFLFWPGSNGSENLLAAVYQAFDRAPAYHFRMRFLQPPSAVAAERSVDIWVVRGIGRREEIREGTKLTAVMTDNLRWLLRWDIADGRVIAHPSRMADPKQSPVEADEWDIRSRDKYLQWGEERRATIERDKDRLDGREVEKVAFSWPGGLVEDRIVVWFDPGSLRPVKSYFKTTGSRGEKWEHEVLIDYPTPETIPTDRFTLQVPRDARLEIDDPQFGRPVYSEGHRGPWLGQ